MKKVAMAFLVMGLVLVVIIICLKGAFMCYMMDNPYNLDEDNEEE